MSVVVEGTPEPAAAFWHQAGQRPPRPAPSISVPPHRAPHCSALSTPQPEGLGDSQAGLSALIGCPSRDSQCLSPQRDRAPQCHLCLCSLTGFLPALTVESKSSPARLSPPCFPPHRDLQEPRHAGATRGTE